MRLRKQAQNSLQPSPSEACTPRSCEQAIITIILHDNQKRGTTRVSSTDEWRVGDTRGPAARRNSVQPMRDEADAMTAQTGLGNVMLSEGLGQERCDCICRKCPARAHLFRRKPSGRDRGWGCLVNRCRISDWEGEKSLGTDRALAAQTVSVIHPTTLCT